MKAGCDDEGGKLEAHHICRQAIFPLLRFDVGNGQTLCRACHRKLHCAVAKRRKAG